MKDLVLIFLLGLATPKGCSNLASVERSETVIAHTFQFILGIFRMLHRKNPRPEIKFSFTKDGNMAFKTFQLHI